jgi:ribosomal protein S20
MSVQGDRVAAGAVPPTVGVPTLPPFVPGGQVAPSPDLNAPAPNPEQPQEGEGQLKKKFDANGKLDLVASIGATIMGGVAAATGNVGLGAFAGGFMSGYGGAREARLEQETRDAALESSEVNTAMDNIRSLLNQGSIEAAIAVVEASRSVIGDNVANGLLRSAEARETQINLSRSEAKSQREEDDYTRSLHGMEPFFSNLDATPAQVEAAAKKYSEGLTPFYQNTMAAMVESAFSSRNRLLRKSLADIEDDDVMGMRIWMETNEHLIKDKEFLKIAENKFKSAKALFIANQRRDMVSSLREEGVTIAQLIAIGNAPSLEKAARLQLHVEDLTGPILDDDLQKKIENRAEELGSMTKQTALRSSMQKFIDTYFPHSDPAEARAAFDKMLPVYDEAMDKIENFTTKQASQQVSSIEPEWKRLANLGLLTEEVRADAIARMPGRAESPHVAAEAIEMLNELYDRLSIVNEDAMATSVIDAKMTEKIKGANFTGN